MVLSFMLDGSSTVLLSRWYSAVIQVGIVVLFVLWVIRVRLRRIGSYRSKGRNIMKNDNDSGCCDEASHQQQHVPLLSTPPPFQTQHQKSPRYNDIESRTKAAAAAAAASPPRSLVRPSSAAGGGATGASANNEDLSSIRSRIVQLEKEVKQDIDDNNENSDDDHCHDEGHKGKRFSADFYNI